jgi:hypothetical protein
MPGRAPAAAFEMIKSLIMDDDLKFLDENVASLREKYLPAALKRPITKEELDDSRARVTMSRARQAAREATELAGHGDRGATGRHSDETVSRLPEVHGGG